MNDYSSIVISMYNKNKVTLDVIDKLLMPSLLNNIDTSKQIIFLDDVSPLRKQTRDIIDKHKPDLERKLGAFQYIENDQNLGFSGSYNKGMKLSEGNKNLPSVSDHALKGVALPDTLLNGKFLEQEIAH